MRTPLRGAWRVPHVLVSHGLVRRGDEPAAAVSDVWPEAAAIIVHVRAAFIAGGAPGVVHSGVLYTARGGDRHCWRCCSSSSSSSSGADEEQHSSFHSWRAASSEADDVDGSCRQRKGFLWAEKEIGVNEICTDALLK